MKKSVSVFVCTRCDAQYPAWQGRCSECEAWGTIVQQSVATAASASSARGPALALHELSTVRRSTRSHEPTGVEEFDRVLSGGLVTGSLTLLGGNPGIGKSTLVLQVAAGVAKHGTVLYVSGEESKEQLKLRYDRLKLTAKNIRVLAETDVGQIVRAIESEHPKLAVVDSVQTVTVADVPGEPGGVAQIKAATVTLLTAAKRSGTSIILVGHVTKEGFVAGPKMLEHLVDTVLYLEGDETQTYRLLRSVKHRFGVTDEVGVLAMTERGLQTVDNPSQLFFAAESQPAPGNATTCIMEGNRPFLVEVQALVAPTSYGYARRFASGVELGRLELLLAVLTKRAGLKLGNQDVHVNLVGGLRVKETAVDAALALAIASGLTNRPLPQKLVVLGEVGLSGELRPVPRLEQRLAEAAKLGMTHVVIPKHAKPRAPKGMTVLSCASVSSAIAETLPSS